MGRLDNDVPNWLPLGLLTVVIAAVLFFLLSPGLPGDRAAQGDAVAAAAERTVALPGATMHFEAHGKDQAGIVRMSGGGAFNTVTGRVYTWGGGTYGPPGQTKSFQATSVLDGLTTYTRIPEISRQLGTDRPWVMVDGTALATAAEQLGLPVSATQPYANSLQGDPKGMIDALGSLSDEMTEEGSETLHGVPTTRYAATVDMEEHTDQVKAGESDPGLDQLLGMVTVEDPDTDSKVDREVNVWIDDAGLIRRESVSFATNPENAAASIEFSDFGSRPKIVVPPRELVFDATGQFLDKFRQAAAQQGDE